MVSHGNDMRTFPNNIATVGSNKELVELFDGSLSSLGVLLDDSHFLGGKTIVKHREEESGRADSHPGLPLLSVVLLDNYMDPPSTLIRDANYFITKMEEKRNRKAPNNIVTIFTNG